MTENKILESMIRQPISFELQAAYDAAHKYLSDNDVTYNETVAQMAVNEAFHAFVNAVHEQSKDELKDKTPKTPHPLRKEIVGMSFPEDRLWQVTAPDFIGALTEYNGEITGTTYNLKEFTNGTFHWFKKECEKDGWKLESIEDRW